MGDQPIAAMHLLHNLNVAFHLLQIRTGTGLQPLYGGEVPVGTRVAMRAEFKQTLDDCRGEVGKEKRRNAERMRVELESAWAAGGSSAQAIEEFMATHLT